MTEPYRADGPAFAPLPIDLEPIADIPIIVAASGTGHHHAGSRGGPREDAVVLSAGVLGSLQPLLDVGFGRSGEATKGERFEIWGHVDILVHDDVGAAVRPSRSTP